jgi:nucleotide-binding universal stress UspA family protein
VAVAAERRVLVGVHGSLGSLQALRYATAEARKLQARLVPVIAWVPPGGDLAERRQPVYSLRAVWREAARDRLLDSFDRALGGVPDGLEVAPEVIRGPAGPVLTDAARQPGDLLVVGTGRRGGLRRLRRSVGRYCLAHAGCPVIAVPPSDLMEEASRGLHLWPRKGGAPALGHPDAWLRRTSSS